MMKVKNYDIVTPGEVLSDEGNGGKGTYSEGKLVISKYLGSVLINERGVSVSPMTGVYLPREGDDVIGRVVGIGDHYWTVNIGAPFNTRLDVKDMNSYVPKGELDRFINVDDLVYARLWRVSSNNTADISLRGGHYGKLPTNLITKVNPMHISRIIGKQGTMVNMIKEHTGCEIAIGQNGIVWVNGEQEKRATALAAINLIDMDYNNPNLAEKVREMLEHVRRTA